MLVFSPFSACPWIFKFSLLRCSFPSTVWCMTDKIRGGFKSSSWCRRRSNDALQWHPLVMSLRENQETLDKHDRETRCVLSCLVIQNCNYCFWSLETEDCRDETASKLQRTWGIRQKHLFILRLLKNDAVQFIFYFHLSPLSPLFPPPSFTSRIIFFPSVSSFTLLMSLKYAVHFSWLWYS